MSVPRIIYRVVSLDMRLELSDHHLFHDGVNGISGPGLSQAALPQNTQPGCQAAGLKVLVLFLSSSSHFIPGLWSRRALLYTQLLMLWRWSIYLTLPFRWLIAS